MSAHYISGEEGKAQGKRLYSTILKAYICLATVCMNSNKNNNTLVERHLPLQLPISSMQKQITSIYDTPTLPPFTHSIACAMRVVTHCVPTSADCILEANVCASITALIAFSVNFSKIPAVTTKPGALRRSAADAGAADFNLVPSRLGKSRPLPRRWGEPTAACCCADALPAGLLRNKHVIVDPLPLLLAGTVLRHLSASMPIL